MQRQTKVIATLGPAVASQEAVTELVEAGMDVARLNFSHGDHDFHRELFSWVRAASSSTGRTVAIMQDIQGPKLRLGKIRNASRVLERGTEVRLTPGGEAADTDTIPVVYEALLEDVEPGHRVILADGMATLEVLETVDGVLRAVVTAPGPIADKCGVAFPDSILSVQSVTPKDVDDLAFGKDLGVDYVAASFVRSAEDVKAVAALVEAPVIAKIELAQALANLDEILTASFGVMVARGDLGVQLPLERIPLIQSDILHRANRAGRISVTATEMLESMTRSARPTRAEVTDVANAVMAGTDAVMLSGETAIGDYPVQAVAAMAKICRTVEQGTLSERAAVPFVGDENHVASAVAQAATQIALNVGARTIVAFTESGSTARLISKYRPTQRIVAFTPNEVTLRRLALYWGVHPHSFERKVYTDDEIASAASMLAKEGLADEGETIVMVAGVPPNFQASTNLVKVHRIGEEAGGLGG
ncbi:MAG: pyruvate kinase [Acidimicrobiia bacterium]|nr:pyruvate kinase [Acidimicrobiia bacterium]